MAATMIAILCSTNFFTAVSFPVEMTSAIGPQSASAWSLDVVADIYSPPSVTLARSCRGWLSIAGISAASRAVALFANFAPSVSGVLSKIAASAASFDKRSIRTSLHYAASPGR
jgi:hypothetical protein